MIGWDKRLIEIVVTEALAEINAYGDNEKPSLSAITNAIVKKMDQKGYVINKLEQSYQKGYETGEKHGRYAAGRNLRNFLGDFMDMRWD